uniref:Uncharacterized protein n=1 Tax=Kalanchoe fedtschenkoi TaxID=63787 RepID=A0A7N0V1B1_KALFE
MLLERNNDSIAYFKISTIHEHLMLLKNQNKTSTRLKLHYLHSNYKTQIFFFFLRRISKPKIQYEEGFQKKLESSFFWAWIG